MEGSDDDEESSSSSEELDSEDLGEAVDVSQTTCCKHGCLKAFRELPVDFQARVC